MGLTAGFLLWEGSALLIGDGFAVLGDEQGKSFRHRGTVPSKKGSWFQAPTTSAHHPGGRFCVKPMLLPTRNAHPRKPVSEQQRTVDQMLRHAGNEALCYLC